MTAPTMVTSLSAVIYQITDMFWLAGVGVEAISIMSFLAPAYILGMALSIGLGAGCGINIAHQVGADNNEKANRFAEHSLVLALIISLCLILFFVVFSRPFFVFMGAQEVLGTILTCMYLFVPFIVIFLLNALFRAIMVSEGAVNRAMIMGLTGLTCNIILDPIFIYVFGLGVLGAILASLISVTLAFSLSIYWVLIKKDLYVKLMFNNLRFEKKIATAIIRIGLPVALSNGTGVVFIYCINAIVVSVGGLDGIAIVAVGARCIDFALLPILSIARSMATVVAAAWGALEWGKLKKIYFYSFYTSLGITVILAIITYLFASQIARIFTWTDGSAHLLPGLIVYLHIMLFSYPAFAFNEPTHSFFVGIGRPNNGFIVNFTKHILISLPLAWLFGSFLNWGVTGVWYGLAAGQWLTALFSITWVNVVLNKIDRNALTFKASRI